MSSPRKRGSKLNYFRIPAYAGMTREYENKDLSSSNARDSPESLIPGSPTLHTITQIVLDPEIFQLDYRKTQSALLLYIFHLQFFYHLD